MKIEYITSVRLSEAGAPTHHVVGVARAFQQAGHDVTLVCPAPGMRADHALEGVRIRQLPYYERRGGWRVYDALVAARLTGTALTGRAADLYYFRISPGSLIAGALKRLRKLKAIELNGLECLSVPAMTGMLRESDFVLVGTEEMRDTLQRAISSLNAEVIVQSNTGIDPERVIAIDQDRARTEIGLPSDALVTLILSSFQPYHDFETAFEALSVIAARRPVVLLIAGSRHAEGMVRANSVQWKDRIDIRFVGPVSGRALSVCISAADVCMNLLSREKLAEGNAKAQKTIDYLAHGRPVIESVDSRLPVPEWARAYTLLVEPQNSKAVVDAVDRILHDRDDALRRAEEGRTFVLAHFAWNRIIARFLDLAEGRLEA